MSDPVLDQRARLARVAVHGQRLGYGLFAVAVAAFIVGLLTGLAGWVTVTVAVALGVGSVVLAPSIVLGYAVKAAAREDRERAAGGPTG